MTRIKMIDWDKLVDNLVSMSINKDCEDEEGNSFTIMGAIQIELQPVKDEIEQLHNVLQEVANVHHGNLQGQIAAEAIGDV